MGEGWSVGRKQWDGVLEEIREMKCWGEVNEGESWGEMGQMECWGKCTT